MAHNAAFDRRFAERLHPYSATEAWGWTMSKAPRREEGFEGLKLAYLAAESGVFYDKHRTLHDGHATLHLLGRPLSASHRPRPPPRAGAHAQLPALGRGRALQARGHVEGPRLPLELRRADRPRAWWTDLVKDALDVEIAFLREHVFGYAVERLQRRVSAFNRYSERV